VRRRTVQAPDLGQRHPRIAREHDCLAGARARVNNGETFAVRLTSFTDYALRVLIFLGLTTDGLVTIEELADRYNISRNHLMKVVHRLATLGYVETVRGKGGGIRLLRAPEDVRVGDVVRDFEEDMAIVECFDARTNTCPIDTICSLRGILRTATGQFLAELDRHTLADLLGARRRLAPLLNLGTLSRKSRPRPR
jgi:Rrf2 family nitric oxide-sensitive transcriptional repressor